MTSGLSQSQRNKIALKASVVAFITLIMFALLGQILFKFFGISVAGFRIAGGIIFFLVGFDMLQARVGRIKYSPEMENADNSADDISITPLAIPMITGPGAITNSIVLMEDANSLALKIILFLSIFTNIIIVYLMLYGSSRIIRFLGDTGNKVLMKLMGLIVMVIAVEFFFAGLKPFVQDILYNYPK
jgi:multiple antibiotic resistance protein